MTDLARLTNAIQAGIADDFRRLTRSIVVVGCGYCEECEPLLELFPRASLTLVDRDQDALETIRSRLADCSSRVHVISGDAARLADLAPGLLDFALVRHPDISAQPEAWARILEAVCGQLRPAGLCMIVTYTTAEAEFVREVLGQLPVRDIKIDPTRSIPVALGGNDRYIMLCEKQ